MELTGENVDSVFENCIGNPGDAGPFEGVINKVYLDLGQLKKHEEEISSMLDQLPDQFHEGSGAGWSFLQACMRQDGVQWTGLHVIQERLILLGLGIGRIRYCLPREYWESFPGSMPYFTVLKKGNQEVEK